MARKRTTHRWLPSAAASALWVVAAVPSAAQVPPNEAWRQVETPHFVVTFPARLDGPVVNRAAASAERAWELLSTRFVDGPSGRVQLLLTDHADVANGFATPIPFNRITIFVSPPMDGSNISYFDDWLELVITHELVHTFHLEMKGTLGSLVRGIFGRVPGAWPVFPSASTPTWFVEGLATYYESQLTGAGRVRGTWHDMVLRTAALEGELGPLDQVGGSTPAWPHGNRPYVFGSSFLQHLSEQYGEEAVVGFARALADQWIPFRLNSAAYDAFQGSASGDWDAWRDRITREAEATRDALESFAPLTEAETVGGRGRLAQQAVVSPDGATLAYSRSDGVERTQVRISAPDGSGSRDLLRLNDVGTLAWTPDGDLVFPQLDFTDPYRIQSDLYRAGLSGEVTRLTEGARLSYADVGPDGRIVAVREGGGTTDLVLVDAESGGVAPFLEGSETVHWAYPRWSPDGRRIAAVRWEEGAFMDVVVIQVTSRSVTPITSDRALDTNPTWTPDGRTVIWASDRSGIPNLYGVSLSPSGSPGATRQITNLIGGAAHPSVDPSGRWIYFSSYHADGWYIERIPFRPETWFEPMPPDPRFAARGPEARVDVDLGPARPYSAWQTLRPHYWSPLVTAAETARTAAGQTENVIDPQVGVTLAGADLVGRHSFGLSALLSIDGRNRFSGGFGYAYSGLGNPTLGLALNQFWDAFPVTFNALLPDSSVQEVFVLERERRALASASFVRRRFRNASSLTLSGGLIREELVLQGLDGSEGPTLEGVRLERTYLEGQMGLFASNTQRRAFSFSAEDGVFGIVRGRIRREADLDSSLRGVLGQDRSFEEVVGEVGVFKAIGGPGFANHVLAVRVSAGAGFGPGADRFHFEIGGAEGVSEGVTGLGLFGGVPLLFPVRGYPRDFRFGRFAWSGSAEYRFPVALVDRGLGSFPLHLDRIHGSVFFDAGNAWGPELGVTGFENPRMGDLASVGAEMSVILQPFYAGNLTVRVGFGYPLRVLSDPRFYVRIGSPF